MMSAVLPARTLSRRARTAALTALVLAAGATALTPGAGAAQAAEPDAVRPTTLGKCASGSLCLWAESGFSGRRLALARATTPAETCETLPDGLSAAAYANRTGKPVTLYESAECAETEEFHTHPSGSWTPRSAYQVQAFKIWKR